MIEVSVLENLLAKFSETDLEKANLQDLVAIKDAELSELKKQLVALEENNRILTDHSEDVKRLAEKILQAHQKK